jgi:D-sedoheptulose 7-phosphate isomerase
MWEMYSSEVTSTMSAVDPEKLNKALSWFRRSINDSKTIWIIGNGGSAATSSHFSVDLSKGCALRLNKRVRAIALMDHVPTQSAWSNDTSYEAALANTVDNFAQEGDIVFSISGSGNSMNIVNALVTAKAMKVQTIGLTGFDGGKIGRLADLEINVPSKDMQIIEDVHHIICHYLSREI